MELLFCQHVKINASQSNNRFEQQFKDFLCQFDNVSSCVLVSGWLTSMPTAQDHFDLTSQEFRDALVVCTSPWTSSYLWWMWDPFLSWSCTCMQKGWLDYNEVRDAIGDIAALAWRHVTSWASCLWGFLWAWCSDCRLRHPRVVRLRHYSTFTWLILTPSLTDPTLHNQSWLLLRRIRSENIQITVLIIGQVLHHCASLLIDFWVVRLRYFWRG